MLDELVKSIALRAVGKGLHLPHAQVDRLAELHFLRELLAQLRIDCVLDVGANRGQFAGELRGIGYSGQIVSFEPVSTEFLATQKNFEKDPKWIGFQFALGGKEESLSINVPKLSVLSSLLESVVPEHDAREELVQVRRLDGMLPELLKQLRCSRVFLKMDTQGFDLEVFRGAAGCMESIQGMQSELSVRPIYKKMPHYLEALAAYEAAGFDLYNLSVVNRVSNGGLLELNCFMRRPG